MLEGGRLACDGRQCFTHFYYITGIGPSILVNDSSARGIYRLVCNRTLPNAGNNIYEEINTQTETAAAFSESVHS